MGDVVLPGQGVRQVVALWPVLRLQKQWSSLIHLVHFVGISFDRLTLLMFMALGSFWEWMKVVADWGQLLRRALMCIFYAWNILAFSIQSLIVVGTGVMDRIMVAMPWSTPREN